jgi:hypothetical protein
MEVYFTASIVGKRDYLASYEKIVNILKSWGHEVVAAHILQTTEAEIHFETKEHRINFHKQLEGWISHADCMVVESSFPSISVGYEISLAIRLGKPVLIVYRDGDPPSLFSEFQEHQIICEKYNDQSLSEVLESFVGYVAGKRDLRFTFFLPADLALYLDQAATIHHLPKSGYLRQLIKQDQIKNTPV